MSDSTTAAEAAARQADEDQIIRNAGHDPSAITPEQRATVLRVAAENATEPEKRSKGAKYFKSLKSGLSIVIRTDPDPTMNVTERFVPFLEDYGNDKRTVGYLKTDNPKVIQACDNDYNVEEIDAKTYKAATEGEKVVQVSY